MVLLTEIVRGERANNYVTDYRYKGQNKSFKSINPILEINL